MFRTMLQQCVLFFTCMILVLFSGQALAADGWYMEMDLGFSMAPRIDVAVEDNDVATTCDEFFMGGFSPEEIPRPERNCNPAPSGASNELDGGSGVLTGLALGYRLGNFRVEGEYFYRTTTHDARATTRIADEVTQDKSEQEIEIADGGVDDVLSHNTFANLYSDFNTDSRFTPYAGVGVGVAQVSLDYFSRWKRNDNPDKIKTFDNDTFDLTDDQRDDLHRHLAGTTTIADRKLKDTLFGYQVLAGVDYRVSDPVSVGLKFRWAKFGEFESDRHEWDQLRSHESARTSDGTPTLYKVTTDDIQFWGISLNAKHAF